MMPPSENGWADNKYSIMMSTIVAPCTPAGGALGVLRISGPEAIQRTSPLFHPMSGAPLTQRPGYSLVFGHLMDGDEVLDEVMVSVFRAPHSFTGEDVVEISCHGSQYIIQRAMQLLVAAGCQMARPGEFTQRAFLNGKMDLSRAEAVADLIAAQNAAQHRVALSQMRGGISRKLAALREQLLHLTTLLELELDFSDHEDLEFADRTEIQHVANAIAAEISRLTDSFAAGNAIKNGIPVAIIGAPNVGKSTLLNQLLQDDKAIVSDIQGTTRDTIEDTFMLEGTLFRLIDTAGIRHTDDRIEQLGIERSLAAAAHAQIIILMNEPGVPFSEIPTRKDQTIIRLTNKTASFQAINGTGLPWLHEQLLKASPVSQNNNEVLITNLRHKEALDKAHQDITQVLNALAQNIPSDLVSEDLRACLHHLGEILGEITDNEILGNIFSHFCVGK